jgi:hypothetical protein
MSDIESSISMKNANWTNLIIDKDDHTVRAAKSAADQISFKKSALLDFSSIYRSCVDFFISEVKRIQP